MFTPKLRTHLKNEEEIKHVNNYKLRRAIFEKSNKLWQLQIPTFPKANTDNSKLG